mmetsp:Transcript_104296/g.185413  ORF Transcript_104296/g.185413 Transcript_104296/m.185413 type:complete len:216 (+) Transcript_104296:280-927(+)
MEVLRAADGCELLLRPSFRPLWHSFPAVCRAWKLRPVCINWFHGVLRDRCRRVDTDGIHNGNVFTRVHGHGHTSVVLRPRYRFELLSRRGREPALWSPLQPLCGRGRFHTRQGGLCGDDLHSNSRYAEDGWLPWNQAMHRHRAGHCHHNLRGLASAGLLWHRGAHLRLRQSLGSLCGPFRLHSRRGRECGRNFRWALLRHCGHFEHGQVRRIQMR